MKNIPLADAIQELRRQLMLAERQGEDKTLRFRAKDVELELKLQVENKKQGNAEVALWSVLSLGAGTTMSDTNVHTLKLKLDPISIDPATGEPRPDTLIGDQE